MLNMEGQEEDELSIRVGQFEQAVGDCLKDITSEDPVIRMN